MNARLVPFAWLTVNEEISPEGFYLEGEAAMAAEREALRAMNAPDVNLIEFQSIVPEDRDSAMVEALVPETFKRWAMTVEGSDEIVGTDEHNALTNLVFYNDYNE
jgi:hypothetical protein